MGLFSKDDKISNDEIKMLKEYRAKKAKEEEEAKHKAMKEQQEKASIIEEEEVSDLPDIDKNEETGNFVEGVLVLKEILKEEIKKELYEELSENEE